MSRVVVAMSGGVDSSVAALLLKEQGHEVIGMTMRLWPESRCCSSEGIRDAVQVARNIGIKHAFLSLSRIFNEKVIKYFLEEYRRGRTPNPCVVCNREIKFRILLEKAKSLGAKFVATGHYARIEKKKGRCLLKKGIDSDKDQSYFLYDLSQSQMNSVIFPIGGYTKARVREIAGKKGLPVAEKPSSQDICFAEDRRISERSAGFKPGPIIDLSGREIGQHKGLVHYTIGQRRGIGISSKEPLYVVAIDASRNAVIVGHDKMLYADCLKARRVRYIIPQTAAFDAGVKIRYRAPAAGAWIIPEGRNAAVKFQKPQRAVTPGQSAVFYDGEYVIGGGIIE